MSRMITSSLIRRCAKRPVVDMISTRSIYSNSDGFIFVNEGINNPENRELWRADPLPISFEDISRAQFNVRSGVVHTHCDYSSALSELCETDIFLKKDLMQRTGSFKERGARYSLLCLSDEAKEKGVVCASAGNHAQAMV